MHEKAEATEHPRIAGLWIYPVKAARGQALAEVELGPLGFAFDRRWMIVREDGRFLTQREEPRLARLVPRLEPDRLRLFFDGEALELPLAELGTPLEVRIWNDRLVALAPDPRADRALSRWLGRRVRIVRLIEDRARPCDPAFAPPGSRTAFTDGFPLLVTNEASHAALDRAILARGGAPVPVERFRPNLLLAGLPAWAEDAGGRLVFQDGTMLLLVKPCSRCIVTTTDQHTGARTGPEPLAALRALGRDRRGEGPTFGQNAVPVLRGGPARLRLGLRATLRA
ncbi:MAG: MOSC N-terminal beta barrel domain-containing protein [Geminicoccaceae bacterium]|nr:MOSC N-terminal beta barrel domain-containing protein [Geminicoccaceae bacterium]MDW8341988.1 MOSC N-terminal beta barrel domain-containing protein [Geminicoccaceae bacterium]